MSRTRHVLHHLRNPHALALRLLRVPCGAHGGTYWPYNRALDKAERWCWKPFGHCDSHLYDHDRPQPLQAARLRAQGHRP